MKEIKVKELIDAGVHFGHLTRKWNPNMSPFIYSEKNGIHIINLYGIESPGLTSSLAIGKYIYEK